MKLNYQSKDGILYAKIPGRSVRRDGKVMKEGQVHLGRVIDKENNVFWNRERGIFTFDPDTGEYGKADESYTSDLQTDHRRKEHSVVDFGDSFFIDSLLHQIGYDKVLDTIPYRNKDTLYAMIQYYILTYSANNHARTWYEGNFANVLYPKANLTSQRISDFLSSIGSIRALAQFFDSHIEWVKTQSKDTAILIDSTGLPNNIHFPLTAVSNHNGKISREVRLTTVLQRDTGYPLLFRAMAGNIVDMSTLTRSVYVLNMHGISADYAVLDAGYYTPENIDELYEAGIEWLTRLPEKYKIYKELAQIPLNQIQKEENLVKYKDRFVYMIRKECLVGKNNDHKAYVYFGYDIDRASDETHKLLSKAKKEKWDEKELHKKLNNVGRFAMISSLPFDTEGILPAYYTRQVVEQYFDISKGASKLTPLRIQSEEAMNGHLMLSMIAATINTYIQNKMNLVPDNREDLLMALRNQKCIVYATRVTTCEPQAKANEFYTAFGIKCPIAYNRKDGRLIPDFHLPKMYDLDE